MTDLPFPRSPDDQSLLPCPFCESDQVSLSFCTNVDSVVSGRFVECEDCAACGPVHLAERDAIAAWNRRSPTPEHGGREGFGGLPVRLVAVLERFYGRDGARMDDCVEALVREVSAVLSSGEGEKEQGSSCTDSGGSPPSAAKSEAQCKSEGEN